MNQIVLEGKKLQPPNDGPIGTIVEQLTPLGVCSMHTQCRGPVARVSWNDGRSRKECLFELIKGKGYALKE